MSIHKDSGITIPAETDKGFKYQYICYKCRSQFDLPESINLSGQKTAECSTCGSKDVQNINAPSCSIEPAGELNMLMWEYLCHNCRTQFELPVPRGPREENETACAACGSRDIQRIKNFEQNDCPPGG